jgi:site-specific DNA-cytosine methylase
MNVLELFAGSRSIGKAAKELGHNVFSVDIEPFEGIDYVVDIMDFDPSKVPFVPDVIWASPPCTGFSVAAIGKNWKIVDGKPEPKSATAETGIALLRKTLQIIHYYACSDSDDPHLNLTFFIENPRGMMRKMSELSGIYRSTITYCQYGDTRMKPTDIWHNCTVWQPKPACKNGDKCHVSAPRGSRTGTQGLKGAYNRSKIPHELCLEVLRASEAFV